MDSNMVNDNIDSAVFTACGERGPIVGRGGGFFALTMLFLIAAPPGGIAQGQTTARQIEPRAGTWKTYVIGSGAEIRVPPPPDRAGTAGEIEWLRSLPDDRNPIVQGPGQILGCGHARIPLDRNRAEHRAGSAARRTSAGLPHRGFAKRGHL